MIEFTMAIYRGKVVQSKIALKAIRRKRKNSSLKWTVKIFNNQLEFIGYVKSINDDEKVECEGYKNAAGYTIDIPNRKEILLIKPPDWEMKNFNSSRIVVVAAHEAIHAATATINHFFFIKDQRFPIEELQYEELLAEVTGEIFGELWWRISSALGVSIVSG